MGNLTTATVFVVVLNILMWFSQLAMLSINPTGTQFYNCEGSILATYSSVNGTCGGALKEDITSLLPSTSGSISATTGNLFTDAISTLMGWVKNLPGVNWLYQIVSAPYSLLVAMGLPAEVSFGIGILWYLVSLLLVVSFIIGRWE